MSVNPRREVYIPPRAQLVDVIIEEQRHVVLKKMGQLGIHAASWEEFDDHKATLGVELLTQHDTDVMFDYIAYGGESFRSSDSVEKTWFNPVHPISVLGSDGLQLLESGEVESYVDASNSRRLEMGNGLTYRDVVDSRAKYLAVRLIHSHRPNGLARIYMAPDVPPVAVHRGDMDYLDAEDSNLPYTLQTSYDAIDRVEEAFGPGAVEYLSDETCRKLIEAIRTTPKQFSNE